MKVTPEFVYDRLVQMRARPIMWAKTREGFVMQIRLLFNLLGWRTFWQDPYIWNNYYMSDAATYNNDGFAHDFIDQVLEQFVQEVMES